MLEEDIPRHFQTFDENRDGLVSKQEVTLDMDRIIGCISNYCPYDTSQDCAWNMKDSKGFDSTQRKTILQIALKHKDTYRKNPNWSEQICPLDTKKYDSFRDAMVDSLREEFGEEFDCFLGKEDSCYYDNVDYAFFDIRENYYRGDVMLACRQEQPGTWCPLTCELNTNSYETVEIIIPQ